MSAIPRADRRGVQPESARTIDPPGRILVLLVAGIGDLVLATPALRALRETFPCAEITLLTSPKAALLAATIPLIDQVQTFEPPEALRRSRNPYAAIKQLRALRRRSFDVLVNLYPVLSLRGSWAMRLLNRAIAARQTVGRNTDGRGTFYDRRLMESFSGKALHETDSMLEVVRLIGATTRQQRPQVWIPPRYARRASRWFRSGVPRVIVQAGSQYFKRWPAERYSRLAEEIHRKWNAEILWNGSPDEKGWITSICSPLEFETRSLAGECDVLELGALLQQSDLLVSNDSGPMHMAAALGVPLVALFGSRAVERFDPRRTDSRSRVIAAKSIDDVSVDEVIQAAGEVLAQRRQFEGTAMNSGSLSLESASAAILAGGRGTRLRQVLADRPKPLAEICGKPFITYLFDQLAEVGVRRVVVCSGYMGEQLQTVFGRNYRDLALDYSQEVIPLGTGGALRLAIPLLASQFVLVLNGDSYCEVDLKHFWRTHKESRAAGSLVLVKVPDTRRYGRVQTDEAGWITRFEEKKPAGGAGWINAGIYILANDWLSEVVAGREISLERDLFPRWVDRGLYGYSSSGCFLDIGTPEDYASADRFFSRRSAAGSNTGADGNSQ